MNTLRAFQGTAVAFDVTLTPSAVDFVADPPELVAEVHKGDGRAPAATLTAAWSNTSTDLVTVTWPGTDALAPGNYLLSVRAADESAYLSYDVLVVYPGTAGDTPLRCLIAPADAMAIIPEFKGDQDQLDGLLYLLESATVACENYCDMKLAITDVDKLVHRHVSDHIAISLDGKPVYDFQARTNPSMSTWSDITQYTQELTDYYLDDERGEVYLRPYSSSIVVGRPYLNRVRLTYRAGYAIDPADIDQGVEPVPKDLQMACLAVAISIREGTRTAGPTLQQGLSGTGRGSYYTKSGTETVIPTAIRPVLDRYARAWGVA